MATCLITVSIGELWDKYVILKLKRSKIDDPTKLAHVETEIELLEPKLRAHQIAPEVQEALFQVNSKLWDTEDALRQKEATKTFDQEFIELARSVYYTNDKRCAIKREINESLGSLVKEVKSYKPY